MLIRETVMQIEGVGSRYRVSHTPSKISDSLLSQLHRWDLWLTASLSLQYNQKYCSPFCWAKMAPKIRGIFCLADYKYWMGQKFGYKADDNRIVCWYKSLFDLQQPHSASSKTVIKGQKFITFIKSLWASGVDQKHTGRVERQVSSD